MSSLLSKQALSFRVLPMVSLFCLVPLCRVLSLGMDDEPWIRAEWVFASPAFDDDGRIEGGLFLRMQPGWHGYGPEPGDLGVAPILRFEGLDGVTVGEARFPEAESFEEAAGISWGYADAVLIRFTFERDQPAAWHRDRPFRLRAEFLFCRDICVPHDVSLSIHWPRDFPGKAGEMAERWQLRLKQGGWQEGERCDPASNASPTTQLRNDFDRFSPFRMPT